MYQYLICSDIDGTLINSDQSISDHTVHKIRKLQEKGNLFYLATGRMFLSASQVASCISDTTGIIASNGGILSQDGHITKEQLTKDCVDEIYRTAKNMALPLYFFSHDTVFYSDILPDFFRQEGNTARLNSGKQRRYQHLADESAVLQYSGDFINGIIISDDQPSVLAEAKTRLSKNIGLNVTSSWHNNIEIMPAGVSKASAIRQLQNYYGIPAERTIVFGDGENDIEMFHAAKISVAVENAPETVKKHAKFSTASNDQEGVYHFLKQYFEREEY